MLRSVPVLHRATGSNARSKDHAQTFTPVFDSRKRKVVGFWQRGSRCNVQLRIKLDDGTTAPRRPALEASNLDKAKAELERKRAERLDDKLPQYGHPYRRQYQLCLARQIVPFHLTVFLAKILRFKPVETVLYEDGSN